MENLKGNEVDDAVPNSEALRLQRYRQLLASPEKRLCAVCFASKPVRRRDHQLRPSQAALSGRSASGCYRVLSASSLGRGLVEGRFFHDFRFLLAATAGGKNEIGCFVCLR